jgi:nucleoside-diphosphate-sugar epimerase
MTRTVLVTGGAGFIGAYVAKDLLARGFHVVAYDIQPAGNVLSLLPGIGAGAPGLALEAGEITDGWRLIDVCRRHGVESLVHLASPLTKEVEENPITGMRDICTGTATVFAVAREVHLRRVVWASSVAVFGPRSGYPSGALPDAAAHRPTSLYGSCKSLCENLARRAYERDKVDVIGLRLSVVYGAGRIRGYMSYPSHMMRAAAETGAIHVAYGTQRLHWQHVEEVAAMVGRALVSDRSGGGLTYNAPGDSRTWSEAAAALRLARPELRVTIGSEIDPALSDVVEDYDASAFSQYYDYEMAWPLERGVKTTLDTYDAMLGTRSGVVR